MKIGIFIGRCQPFTNGHQSVINEIIKDNLEPLVLLGSSNIPLSDKNPLYAYERESLIRLVYPNIQIRFISDYDNWEEWYLHIKDTIDKFNAEEVTIYSHCKDIDKIDFRVGDKIYQNEHYIKMFEEDYNIKYLSEEVDKIGKTIHASDVRQNEDNAKRNLDARVYIRLKEMGWWK